MAFTFNWGSIFHSVWDVLVNKFHIALAVACQSAVLFYAYHFQKDLGPGIVNTVYAFYAFLGGHAFTYQKWPDQDSPIGGVR